MAVEHFQEALLTVGSREGACFDPHETLGQGAGGGRAVPVLSLVSGATMLSWQQEMDEVPSGTPLMVS